MKRLANENEPKQNRSQFLGMMLLVIIAIAAGGAVLIVVSSTFQWPSSDFVTLPASPPSTSGTTVLFSNVSPVTNGGVALGVQGYLKTQSGTVLSNAQVYLTYYFEGAYRTQSATTDQNGYFLFMFPMNWTGWLPVTVTYFGDNQHKGLTRMFAVAGEALIEDWAFVQRN